MILFKRAADLHNYLVKQRNQGVKTGFVPTMGALHEGHISLIKEAKKENDYCISSIFVNPTQFNDPNDFKKYPITLEKDIRMLEAAGCDILFHPPVNEMYPQGTASTTHYELGYLESILEGKYRPGHFQGVCTIVHRLLEIVGPCILYLGQKDYQQCLVVKEMIRITGLGNLVGLHIAPTLREQDGLAMSSRNMRLSIEERQTATTIFHSLQLLKDHLKPGGLEELKKQSERLLVNKGFRVDYIEVADATSLQTVNEWDGKQKIVALAAAFLNEVRLIDNILLN